MRVGSLRFLTLPFLQCTFNIRFQTDLSSGEALGQGSMCSSRAKKPSFSHDRFATAFQSEAFGTLACTHENLQRQTSSSSSPGHSVHYFTPGPRVSMFPCCLGSEELDSSYEAQDILTWSEMRVGRSRVLAFL